MKSKVKQSLKAAIKIVLFDHDDTLVRTIKAKWAQHKYIAKTFYNKKLKNEELTMHWGKPLTVLMKHLYETDHIDMAMSYNIATRSRFPKKLFKDTLDTLNVIRQSGIKVGLVTATTQASLNYDFQTLEIPKNLFDYIQTEDDTIFHKPDPRVFEPTLEWLAQNNIQTTEVLYVGDQLSDMKAANSAGFEFIGVTTGLYTAEDFDKHHVKSVSNLSDLIPILSKEEFVHSDQST